VATANGASELTPINDLLSNLRQFLKLFSFPRKDFVRMLLNGVARSIPVFPLHPHAAGKQTETCAKQKIKSHRIKI
jgi:hypothetical protein